MPLDGAIHLPGRLTVDEQASLAPDIRLILLQAPLYTPTMPRTGKPLSVRMSNCGPLGWTSDRLNGYSYVDCHPETGRPWPAIPPRLIALWHEILDCPPEPEACLINWYGPGTKLGLHRDNDEIDRKTAVLSVSLGDDAWFRTGGLKRGDPTERVLLKSGDVFLLSASARLSYHGIDRIVPGSSDLLGEPGRINLTMRRVNI